MKRIKIFLIILVMFNFLSSCMLRTMSGSKGKKTYYEDFFVSDSVNQYFLKPLMFKFNKEKIYIDFTFRDSILTCTVTANYTVETPQRTAKIDSAYFLLNKRKIYFTSSKKMFIEKNKDLYKIRYTNELPFEDFSEICKNSEKVIFNVFYNNQKHIFVPTKKTVKYMNAFYNDVIDVIYLSKSK